MRLVLVNCVVLLVALNNAIAFESPALIKQENNDSWADIDLVVEEALQAFAVPGVAIGVVSNNQVILSRGYGMRNVEKNLPVTEETLFPIGSCTKAFTTLLLAQLVEEKLIAWDDPVINYVPEFRLLNEEVSSEITIRDLAAHRTGMPRHDAIWFCNKMPRDKVLACLQNLQPICPLRTKWYYNNFMYAVAGILIERVTGLSWEEALQERILSPLQMTSSSSNIGELLKNADISFPYADHYGEVQTVAFHPLDAVAPGGAINSNVVDLLKWVQIQLNSGFVKTDSLKEMHSIQMPFLAGEREGLGISQLGYGLGWFVGQYKDEKVISHGGVIDGFTAEVSLLPEKNIGIVILSNSSSDGTFAVASIRNHLLDHLLGTSEMNWNAALKPVRDQIKAVMQSLAPLPSKTPTRSLEEYAGLYEHPAYGVVEVVADENQLRCFYGDIVIPLRFDHDDVFQGRIAELLKFGLNRVNEYVFHEDYSNVINEVHIAFEPDAKPIIFKRK